MIHFYLMKSIKEIIQVYKKFDNFQIILLMPMNNK